MEIKILELLEEATNLLDAEEEIDDSGIANRCIWSAQVLAMTAIAYALMDLNATLMDTREE